jgi:hypothetical protein
MTLFALLLLASANAFAQETPGKGVFDGNLINGASDSAATVAPAESKPKFDAALKRTESADAARTPQASVDEDKWHFEVRPYLWLAGIYGRLRVNNTTAETGESSTSVLGMLDFAAAAQVEAIKGRWRVMLDENYVNLGTTGTGPLGNVTVDVQPTLNVFEFGASYTFAKVANKNATASEPLPPVFTAEVLGGGRYFHLGLGLRANNNPGVEGSRNLVGPFVGNRIKVSPHKAVTLIGKYTVGGSGAGSNFAWSAEGLVDIRLRKSFSIGGGYRALDMNADQPSNRVGFDGQLRGLIMTLTFYR